MRRRRRAGDQVSLWWKIIVKMAATPFNVGDIASDIVQVWGIPDFLSAPDFAKDRAAVEINAAIQQMQDAGEDFYGREDVVIDLVANQAEYELDSDIQSVLEPVELQDGTQLRQLTSRGQALQYGQIFRNRLTSAVSVGKPEAYFVDAKRSATDDDTVTATIQFFPAPSAGNISNKAVVPVIREAAQFNTAALSVGTANLGVPHKYVQSIFLPLARHNATTFFLFYQKEKMPKYEEDYSRALKMLGKADPRGSAKPPDSNTEALDLPSGRQPPQQ